VTNPSRATAGAAAEFSACVRAFDSEFDFVYRSLRRHGASAADAEDLAQDVFLVMWRRRADYDPERPLRAWLSGIAYRVAYEHRKRVGREVPSGFVDAQDQGGHAEERLASSSERHLVLRALALLPEKHRAVLVMHDLDGVPMQGVAANFSIPIPTGYSRLRSARQAFAKTVRRLQTAAAFGTGKGTPAPEALLALERELQPASEETRQRVLTRVRGLVFVPEIRDREPPPPPAPPRRGMPLGAGLGAAALLTAAVLVLWYRAPAAPKPTQLVAFAAVRATPATAAGLSRGLVGYWRFDDGAGSAVARDLSPSGADCHFKRNLDPQKDWIAGALGGALAFTGRGWLECPPVAFAARITEQMTLAAWLMKEPSQANLRAVVTRQLGDDSLDAFMLAFQERELFFGSHVWHNVIRRPFPLALGPWVHVAATHDAAGVTRLFINGVEAARVAGERGSIGGGPNPLVLGGAFNGRNQNAANQRFQGGIDELVLYDRALSDEEVAALASGVQPRL
jgi:RNA polymerase sigma-70 factor (ECF subfamily)